MDVQAGPGGGAPPSTRTASSDLDADDSAIQSHVFAGAIDSLNSAINHAFATLKSSLEI